jgi:hypothetical protein
MLMQSLLGVEATCVESERFRPGWHFSEVHPLKLQNQQPEFVLEGCQFYCHKEIPDKHAQAIDYKIDTNNFYSQ